MSPDFWEHQKTLRPLRFFRILADPATKEFRSRCRQTSENTRKLYVHSASPNPDPVGNIVAATKEFRSRYRQTVADVARLLRAPENATSTPLPRILALYEILWRLRKNFSYAGITRWENRSKRKKTRSQTRSQALAWERAASEALPHDQVRMDSTK